MKCLVGSPGTEAFSPIPSEAQVQLSLSMAGYGMEAGSQHIGEETKQSPWGQHESRHVFP